MKLMKPSDPETKDDKRPFGKKIGVKSPRKNKKVVTMPSKSVNDMSKGFM